MRRKQLKGKKERAKKKKLFHNCGLRCRRNDPSNGTSSRPKYEPFEPPRASGILLGQSRPRALAFCGRGRAPQHVLCPRDVKETVGADADFDLQPAARVKVLSWSFRSCTRTHSRTCAYSRAGAWAWACCRPCYGGGRSRSRSRGGQRSITTVSGGER